jgi:hypothetical protein
MDAMIQQTRFDAPRLFHDVAALARRYCDIIDLSGSDWKHWLRDIANLLPRLQVAVVSVSGEGREVDPIDLMDLDARFELFAHLRRLLADRDSYWLEFDSGSEGADAMTGSLADDLTDIYCELKQGLLLYELDPDDAMALWSSGYERHWGRHLIDADRHLAMLGAQARLDR